jgi:hypothetical protein
MVKKERRRRKSKRMRRKIKKTRIRPLRERDDHEERTTETKKRMLMRQIDLSHRARILPALAAGTLFLSLSIWARRICEYKIK